MDNMMDPIPIQTNAQQASKHARLTQSSPANAYANVPAGVPFLGGDIRNSYAAQPVSNNMRNATTHQQQHQQQRTSSYATYGHQPHSHSHPPRTMSYAAQSHNDSHQHYQQTPPIHQTRPAQTESNPSQYQPPLLASQQANRQSPTHIQSQAIHPLHQPQQPQHLQQSRQGSLLQPQQPQQPQQPSHQQHYQQPMDSAQIDGNVHQSHYQAPPQRLHTQPPSLRTQPIQQQPILQPQQSTATSHKPAPTMHQQGQRQRSNLRKAAYHDISNSSKPMEAQSSQPHVLVNYGNSPSRAAVPTPIFVAPKSTPILTPTSAQSSQGLLSHLDSPNPVQSPYYRPDMSQLAEQIRRIGVTPLTPTHNTGTTTPTAAESASDYNEWNIDQSELVVGKEIGKGTFATVYKAAWHGTDVAVKKLKLSQVSEAEQEDIRREVSLMKKLHHPNIIQLLGICAPGQELWVVTELLYGSLFSMLHRRDVYISWTQMLGFLVDISKGMAYLHGRNPPIIHRDLKTLNLLVDAGYRIKITDFGLSKTYQKYMTAKKGTYQWMAPEVIKGSAYSALADVFSFGIVAWEVISRQGPYSDLDPMQVAFKVVNEGLRPVVPTWVHPDLHVLIEDCWHADQTKRPTFTDILKVVGDIKTRTHSIIVAPSKT
mmetsp:Transcript_1472/g.1658  ORF Transcript_1472/g.1658 Transcript_1472/m.1658 type:complete len:652 (-) Transcript_1472:59-2014(-)